MGKSKLALEKIKSICREGYGGSLLIVVPRNVHKKNWEEEINKWWPDNDLVIAYTTYVSFPKYKGSWTYVIFDECHHLSERCREALCDFDISHSVLLSATVNSSLKDELKEVFDNLQFLKIDSRKAIDEGLLPDPKVYLIPLTLRNDFPTEAILKNPKAKGKLINCSWSERWHFMRQKAYPVMINCTEKQYMEDLNSSISWWKDRCTSRWLKLCGDRLRWLSRKKEPYIKVILEKLKNSRTLVFCCDIKQTETLGSNCINSKNKESEEIYRKFNEGIIDHITACNMLNEGLNLNNCQVGIYANLNSSDTIVQQRAGRLLRHPSPIIIIPYYKGTREEELVDSMLDNYNPDLVFDITDINTMEYEVHNRHRQTGGTGDNS